MLWELSVDLTRRPDPARPRLPYPIPAARVSVPPDSPAVSGAFRVPEE